MIEMFAGVLMLAFFFSLIWETRKQLFMLLLFLFAVPMYSQSAPFGKCAWSINDNAGMFPAIHNNVMAGVNALINQGADVHVVTVYDSHGNLDLLEKQQEMACPEWRGATGARKSTLLVIVASQDHKSGIYYGAAWHKALDDRWNGIKTDYMIPRFKDGDYAGGFAAVEEQLVKRIIASKDEALHPAVSTTINQAADYSGLWLVMKWLMIVGCLFGIGYFMLRIMSKLKRIKEATQAGQQAACIYRSQAAVAINAFSDRIKERTALGQSIPLTSEAYFQQASELFGRLGNDSRLDPEASGLTVDQYNEIKSQYASVSKLIGQAQLALGGQISKESKSSDGPKWTASDVNKTDFGVASQAKNPEKTKTTEPKQEPKIVEKHYHTTTYVERPTYVEPSPVYIQPPVVIETPVYEVPVEPRHHHRNDDDDSSSSSSSTWSSSSSSSSDSYSGGGGSSSWSNDDSSSSNSGGSSSFDAGSSDSGGGGSSDW